MHSITSKLNKDATQHQNTKGGVTFFVNLGERNYKYQTKEKLWTNYSAAIFATDGQVDHYAKVLRAGNVIEVSCSGCLIEPYTNKNTGVVTYKNIMVDAKLGYTFEAGTPMPAVIQQQVQEIQPQQQPQQAQPMAPPQQQAPQQASPYIQPAGPDAFDGFPDDQPF